MILIEKGLKTKFYTERAKLLHDLPVYTTEKGKKNIYKLDAQINVGNLTISLFANAPSLHSNS